VSDSFPADTDQEANSHPMPDLTPIGYGKFGADGLSPAMSNGNGLPAPAPLGCVEDSREA